MFEQTKNKAKQMWEMRNRKIRIKIEIRKENRIRKRKGGEIEKSNWVTHNQISKLPLSSWFPWSTTPSRCIRTLSKVENDTIYGNLRLRCYSFSDSYHTRSFEKVVVCQNLVLDTTRPPLLVLAWKSLRRDISNIFAINNL